MHLKSLSAFVRFFLGIATRLLSQYRLYDSLPLHCIRQSLALHPRPNFQDLQVPTPELNVSILHSQHVKAPTSFA